MKKVLLFLIVAGYLSFSSLTLACPGHAKCDDPKGCKCEGASCPQETQDPKKEKKEKTSTQKPEAPQTPGTASN